MQFEHRILRGSHKELVVPRKVYIGDSASMRTYRFIKLLKAAASVKRNRSLVAPKLDDNYSPPTKNKTESVRSHLAACSSKELLLFALDDIVDSGYAKFL